MTVQTKMTYVRMTLRTMLMVMEFVEIKMSVHTIQKMILMLMEFVVMLMSVLMIQTMMQIMMVFVVI